MKNFGRIFTLSALISAGGSYAVEGVKDRFGGPLSVSDVVPAALDPFHPLNPADLAMAGRTLLEFGVHPNGSSFMVGLPNFLISVSKEEISWNGAWGDLDYRAFKYELGYGISTADIGWGSDNGPILAIGTAFRYLDFQPKWTGILKRSVRSFGDVGVSAWMGRYRLDAVVMNLVSLGKKDQDVNLPGRMPREINAGLSYGPKGNWIVSGRVGIQDAARLGPNDTAQQQALLDLGFEKLFFRNVTFRVGTQRRYAAEKLSTTREIETTLSGGIWYRLASVGTGYQYPDVDKELPTLQTLRRMLRDVELGAVVVLGRNYGTNTSTNRDGTTLLMTLGKRF